MLKKIVKIVCITILIVFVLSCTLFIRALGRTEIAETTDIAYYQALSGETDGPNTLEIFGDQVNIHTPYDLPRINELENSRGYRFQYTAKLEWVFQYHTYILIVEYDEDAYLAEKERLEGEYIWMTDPIEGEDEGVSPIFELDGFAFRAVKGGWYPKEMFFVGTSDVRCEIAYIFFYDQDLDFVSPSVGEFLVDNSGWDKVVD